MTELRTQPTTLLIDVKLPDPDPIPTWLLGQLGVIRVILVGWFALPEQTDPTLAREQFSEEAQEELDRLAKSIRDAGGEVESHLVFTPDELDTVERISTEENCDALLLAQPLDELSHLLVPVRGLQNADRIARFVADLVRESTTDVTLLHVLEAEEAPGSINQEVLEPMMDKMLSQGVPEDRLHKRVVSADDQAEAIIETAQEYDAVVIGETAPSIREVIFGSVPEQIAQDASVPVMLVRQMREK